MDVLSRRQFLKQAGALGVAGLITTTPAAAQPQATGTSPTRCAAHPSQPAPSHHDQERTPQWWPVNWAENNIPPERAYEPGDHFYPALLQLCHVFSSRGTLFTGLYAPRRISSRAHPSFGGSASASEKPLPPQLANLATILATAGYHVALKGKWHLSKSSTGGAPGDTDVAAYGFKDWQPTTVGEANDKADYGGGCADLDAVTIEQAVNFLNDAACQSLSA